MIEDIIQKRLASLLQQFMEVVYPLCQFQKFLIGNKQGLSIKNTKIKPKLIEELSQILSMPLEHVKGSVQTLSLNLPWQRLFMLQESEINITIQGVKLTSKLKNAFSEAYILKKRQRLIDNLTEKIFNPLDTSHQTGSFINKKLQEYFLSTIVLEVRDLSLEIQIDLKHKVQLILKVDSCRLRKQNKRGTNKIHLSLQGVGLYYRAGTTKEVELVSPANLEIQRTKTEGGELNRRVSILNFNIDVSLFTTKRILLHLNNYNYGDIARVVLLIQWHNSFIDIPYSAWKTKPFVLSQSKPSAKFVYCCHLIKQSISDNNFKKQLQFRRRYLRLYVKFLTNTVSFGPTDKTQLAEMEKEMAVWKIVAYRSFAINLTKSKIENDRIKKALGSEKGQLDTMQRDSFNTVISMVNNLWFRRWFDGQNNSKQLTDQFLKKIASIEAAPNEVQSAINIKVQAIVVSLQIITNFGNEPFVSLKGYHCQYNKKELLVQKSWQKSLQFRKCKIQFQKYLGHHERYKNMLAESKQHFGGPPPLEEEDQFEEIDYFLELNYNNDSQVINIKLLPFDLYINHQVIEKLAILLNIEQLSKISNVEKIEQAYLGHYNPWLIVQQQKQEVIQLKRSKDNLSLEGLPSPLRKEIEIERAEDFNQPEGQQVPAKRICLKSAANIIVMADLRAYPTTEIVLQLGSFQVNIKPNKKEISIRSIILKGKFTPEQKQQESIYLNLIEPQVTIVPIISNFDLNISVKSHLSFDELFLEITPIKITFPSLENIVTIIDLIYQHIPRHKENRLKQYYRRKQSIGQEFMDACENLNEHINKSIVMSSERMTTRTYIKERRTKITSLALAGISFHSQFLDIKIGQIHLSLKQVGYDSKSIESYNQKSLRVEVKNIKQTIRSMQSIMGQIKKQNVKKGFGKTEQKTEKKFSNLQVAHIQLAIIFMLHSSQGQRMNLYIEGHNLKLQSSQQANSRRLSANLSISYDEERLNHPGVTKTPLLQQCLIQHEETLKFNLLQHWVGIHSLAINIKPSLFKFLGVLMSEYHIEDRSKYAITNGVINTINIKLPPKNYYVDFRFNQRCIVAGYSCELTIFNKKYGLQFNHNLANQRPQPKTQQIFISQNNFLLNREIAPNQYRIESNIRFVNHQDRTIWLKLGELEENRSLRQVDNKKKLAFIQHKPYSIDITQEITFNQREWDAFNPKRKPSKSQRKSMTIPLKPKQQLHLFIDSQEHKFLQIVDQGSHYTELSIDKLFEGKEIVICSEDQDQCQYLVLRTEVKKLQGKVAKIYKVQIYSPVYIVNKTPWMLEYRLSEDEGSVMMEGEEKKAFRRRSFEVIPMKKIHPLYSEKIRNLHYDHIQSMRLSLKKYERQFPVFSSLIQRIKQARNGQSPDFIRDSELVTLRNGKEQIQVIICLQFSANVMKIKLHPQFIFVNLSSIPLTFRVKEQEVVYHQIKLPSLRIQQKERKNNDSRNINAYLNELGNLSNDRLKTKDVLKQLFQNYEAGLEAFTGSLRQDISKKIVYYSGKEVIKKQKGFLKSSAGYRSDYAGSENEQIQERILKKQALILSQEVIKYGPEEHFLFKRSVVIQKYFTLVLFLPTVHIINKSQATFYSKSLSQKLVKVPKESHNFIVTSMPNIDLQACLQDEQISLSQWIRVDLQDLRTIYYPKDMIQHHGSGYESKQYNFRKKRMKKVPKIFYKVIICRYQWGQKILIEQSQYPPISFINNTSHRIKIQETTERFSEELINRGDMGEYAPKDPYHTPYFRLSVAEHYEYRTLKEFGVSEKQVFTLEYGILLSIEQYKDKAIINIKEANHVKLSVSTVEKNLLREYKQSEQKGDFMLEQVSKKTLEILEVTIAILNNWNRQLNATVIEGLTLTHQIKNYKDYYKLQIKSIEGYDYMGLQPQFIFVSKQPEKPRFLKNRIKKPNFISFSAVVNYHKNALIIEQCEGTITESIFYISTDLILAYVKNYYEPCSIFASILKYHKRQGKPSQHMSKKFIVESLKWNATSLTIKTRNLSILQTFLNKSYQRLIVKFLNWIGDVKPFTFDSFQLNHEQTTLRRLINQINMRKKLQNFGALLMDYPLNELKQILMLFSGDQETSTTHRLHTFYKIFKSFEYIVSWTLGLNQNLKMQVKSYNQLFIQQHKHNNNIIDKMKQYQYCQWKYQANFPTNKLKGKFKRLERYNQRRQILKYDQNTAKIKVALDSFVKNKVHRKISRVHKINQEHLTCFVGQWIVLFFSKNSQWLVIRPEHFLDCNIQRGRLVFTYWEKQAEDEQKARSNGTGVKQLHFSNLDEGDFLQELQEFKLAVKQSILSCFY